MGQNISLGQSRDGLREANGSVEERSTPQRATPRRPRRHRQTPRSMSTRSSSHSSGQSFGSSTGPLYNLPEMMTRPQELWEVLHREIQQRVANERSNTNIETNDQGGRTGTSAPNNTHIIPGLEGLGRLQMPQSNGTLPGTPWNAQQSLLALSQRLRHYQEQLIQASQQTNQRDEQHQSMPMTETDNINTTSTGLAGRHHGEAALVQLFTAAADAAARQMGRQRQRAVNETLSQGTTPATSLMPDYQASALSSVSSAVRHMIGNFQSMNSHINDSTIPPGNTNNTENSQVRRAFERFLSSLDLMRSSTGETNQSQTRSTSPDNFVRVFRLDDLDNGPMNAENGTSTADGLTSTPNSWQRTTTATTSPPSVTAEVGSHPTTSTDTNISNRVPVIIVGVRSLAWGAQSHTINTSIPTTNIPSSTTVPRHQNSQAPNLSTANFGLSSPRSWLIYIVGGSYPADHPILRLSELNLGENATYEDLIRLSEVLGPARPITVTQADIDAAGLEVRTLNAKDLANLRDIVKMDTPTPDTKSNGRATLSQADTMAHSIATRRPVRQTRKRCRDSMSKFDTGSTASHRPQRRRRLSNRKDPLTGDQCTVCLSEWDIGDVVRVLHCRHSFHRECVDRWLQEGADHCPICRAAVVRRSNTGTKEGGGSPAGEPIATASQ